MKETQECVILSREDGEGSQDATAWQLEILRFAQDDVVVRMDR